MNPPADFLMDEIAAQAVARVADDVRRHFPAARALILTGSTARGEATVIRVPEGARWLSDLELLVVVPNSLSLPEAARALGERAGDLRRELAQAGTQVAIELTAAPERYFASLRPHLFAYELRRHGKQLFGAEDYLGRIPPFAAAEIPREDAWRLLSNRMVEWLAVLGQEPPADAEVQFYLLSKQYLDLVTSLSVFSGHYQGSYRERAAALRGFREWLERNLPELASWGLVEGGRIAAGFKLTPQGAAYEWLWRNRAADLRAGLETAGWAWLEERLPAMLLTAWGWELPQLSGREVRSGDDALRASRAVYGFTARLRGWGRLLFRPGLRSGARFVGRMIRLFARGNPRALVYVCAQQLLESRLESNPARLAWVRRHLPALFGEAGDDWRELTTQCVQNWRKFLRMARA